jgi:hypothetical protein
MKAHRREAKNTALIECVQVAAEKSKWQLREEFKRMSSLKDGGGERALIPLAGASSPAPARAPAQQRTPYDRTPQPAAGPAPLPLQPAAPPAPSPPPTLPAPPPASHGAVRFSSVFGSRRR